MTVKDILKDAILFTGKTELLSLNTFNSDSQTSPTIDQQADIDLYVKCFNFIYKEIASSYASLLKKEKVTFVDNKYNYADLTESVVNVKSLKNSVGKNVYFHLYPTYIEAEVGKAEIIYAYLPNDLEIADNVNLFGGQILPQVIAYGIAREFCLINGDYSDADVWENRFKNGVFMALSQKRNKKIPARRFR